MVLTTFLCLRVVLAGWADAGDFSGQGWRGPMPHRGLSKKTQPVFVQNLSWLVFRSWGLATLLEPPDRGRDLLIGRYQASDILTSALIAIIIACFSLENALQLLEFAMTPLRQVSSGDVKGFRERL